MRHLATARLSHYVHDTYLIETNTALRVLSYTPHNSSRTKSVHQNATHYMFYLVYHIYHVEYKDAIYDTNRQLYYIIVYSTTKSTTICALQNALMLD